MKIGLAYRGASKNRGTTQSPLSSICFDVCAYHASSRSHKLTRPAPMKYKTAAQTITSDAGSITFVLLVCSMDVAIMIERGCRWKPRPPPAQAAACDKPAPDFGCTARCSRCTPESPPDHAD